MILIDTSVLIEYFRKQKQRENIFLRTCWKVFRNGHIYSYQVRCTGLRKNKIIGFADIAIGATARVHDLELATLNERHFSRVSDVKLIKRS